MEHGKAEPVKQCSAKSSSFLRNAKPMLIPEFTETDATETDATETDATEVGTHFVYLHKLLLEEKERLELLLKSTP